MEIISHANVMPWLVEPSFFLQLFLQAMLAALILALTGLFYAGLRRLLSNGDGIETLADVVGGVNAAGTRWATTPDYPPAEEYGHEA